MGDSSYGLLCMEIIIFCCLFKHLIENHLYKIYLCFMETFQINFYFIKKLKRCSSWKIKDMFAEKQIILVLSQNRVILPHQKDN